MGHMKDLDRRIRQGGDDAIAAAGELLPRWILVSERLPEDGDTVWGFDADGVGLCEYHGPRCGFQSYGSSCDVEGLHSESLPGITHWMELQMPEPPEVKP